MGSEQVNKVYRPLGALWPRSGFSWIFLPGSRSATVGFPIEMRQEESFRACIIQISLPEIGGYTVPEISRHEKNENSIWRFFRNFHGQPVIFP